eukprot:scaffold44226_cov145-Amphora_coffeaeformis.AAC.1
MMRELCDYPPRCYRPPRLEGPCVGPMTIFAHSPWRPRRLEFRPLGLATLWWRLLPRPYGGPANPVVRSWPIPNKGPIVPYRTGFPWWHLGLIARPCFWPWRYHSCTTPWPGPFRVRKRPARHGPPRHS